MRQQRPPLVNLDEGFPVLFFSTFLKVGLKFSKIKRNVKNQGGGGRHRVRGLKSTFGMACPALPPTLCPTLTDNHFYWHLLYLPNVSYAKAVNNKNTHSIMYFIECFDKDREDRDTVNRSTSNTIHMLSTLP